MVRKSGRRGGDRNLRELTRACAAAPRDLSLWTRYARELERAWSRARAPELRDRYALALVRTRRPAEAAQLLGIRWEANPAELGDTLYWKAEPLDAEALTALVDEDLRLIDPLRLLESFPRTKEGELRLNTTRYLRRYQAHDHDQPYRRLVLLAWTPGTSTHWHRPDDRGQRRITIGLETRSVRGTVLKPELWRDG
jgi:hypothetical protein